MMHETHKPKMTPSDFFLHLGIMVALYISAVSVISLLFGIINKVFPDSLNYYYDSASGAIRMAVAALIIMFPLYLLLGWIYSKQLKATPEKKSLGIRKWLIYFTLFIAGLTLAIDLIVLVYNLLGGEITTRFLLKVLSVLAVAGMIFSYYLSEIRTSVERHFALAKKFGSVAIVAVLASIIAGFFIVGSPVTQRKMQFDNERVSHLQTIQYQIVNYWQQKQKLPLTLADLRDPISGFVTLLDPETKTPYVYEATGKLSFKVCATFSLPSRFTQNTNTSVPIFEKGMLDENWQHEAGYSCFERTIDPELYPPAHATIRS